MSLFKKIRRSNKLKDYEFLPAYLEITEKPPSPWARGTAIAISSFLLGILMWSVFGKLEIHASSEGKLIVSSKSKIVQAVEHGEIKSIHVRDGQFVEKGDVLIELNPIGATAERARLTEQLSHYMLEKSRLEALLKPDPVSSFIPPRNATTNQKQSALSYLISEHNEYVNDLEAIKAEKQVLFAQIEANKEDLTSLKRLQQNIISRLNANKKLKSYKAISEVDFLTQEKELLEVNRTISSINSETKVLNARLLSLNEQSDSISVGMQRECHEKINRVVKTISQINQDLIKAEEKLRLQTIISPVNGVIQQLSVNTLGGVVTPAQSLMVIVPRKANLEGEIKVLNKDIGFINSGQSVEVKLDSFPFTKYGTIKGEVMYVSRDSIEDPNIGNVFLARVKLYQDSIKVENKYVSLTAGMSIKAEIRTGERKIIEYILSPLQRYQDEALRER
ncbi:HlyD family type I secretion periplasmic adaptor subunit [Vibrio sp. vnigr-6D03]|uniref:HlyD family type I secretion periplasmic adaptor subunit n=1 Tax=Vibrio sp. vnigr-6D03 TaxID=2058088 RepID=UPI0015E147E1|nr:HlyD family type I secretion periplasmic adaptor subunit [Vibrio sp. vnigr-6D03]